MSQDTPFDRALRRLRRDRAASRFAGADYLHRLVADEMLERLDFVKRGFSRALDLGCADGHLGRRLAARGMDVVAADPGLAFARAASGLQCDEDRLPFAGGSFDLVVWIGALDGVNDVPAPCFSRGGR
jgi:SAM-dependent methyltransferase